MKHCFTFGLSLLTLAVATASCTEPSAEDRALAKVWVVHVDRPADPLPLLRGTEEGLTASAFDSAGALITVPLEFAWSSSDSSVASVDAAGRIAAKKPGVASIYARLANGIVGSRTLYVRSPEEVYAINPDNSRMLVGQRRTLVLQFLGAPTVVPVQGWTSSNPSVATVDDNGIVTAVAPGSTTIGVPFANTIMRAQINVADIITPLRFASVAIGSGTTCAIATDGAAYCWGIASGGSLGTTERVDQCVHWLGYQTPFTGVQHWDRTAFVCAMEPVRVATALRFESLAMQDHSASFAPVACGRTSGGEVHCWGGVGGLFAATDGPTLVPVSTQLRFISFPIPCGVTTTNDAWCYGDPTLRGAAASASTTPTQVTGSGIWRSVTGGLEGTTHRCGITTTDSVACWGSNSAGMLGTGDTTASTTPVPVQTTEKFSSVAVTRTESCALSLDQRLYCWGAGRLTPTLLSTTLHFTALALGGGICAIGTDAVRYCRTESGALADASPGTLFRSLAVGGSSACAILLDGLLYCQGANDFGSLGTGDLVYGVALTKPVVGQ